MCICSADEIKDPEIHNDEPLNPEANFTEAEIVTEKLKR